MSITSEIQRINTNISNAYTACEDKGATIPTIQNSANLAECIYSITGGGGVGIPREITSTGIYQMPVEQFTFSLPSNVIDIGLRGLAYAFYGCTYLVGINLSHLTKITGSGALQMGFQNCTNLLSIDFSNVVTISGSSAFSNAFMGCSKLVTINFESLETVSSSSCFNYAFRNCTKLTSVEFTNLKTISGSRAFESAFAYSSIKSISFPALIDLGTGTDRFYGMLSGVSGCTVHFPAALKNVIGNWTDVLNGFGGTNTTVLFDLHGVDVDFNISSEDATLYLNGVETEERSLIIGTDDICYTAHDATSNTVITGQLTDLEPDTSRTINIDFSQQSHKITLSVGMNDLTVMFNLGNTEIPATAESGGKYSINVIGSDIAINYYVNGGSNYNDAEGTITTTDSNITQNVTLTSATLHDFIRPTLNSDNVMGGDNFAVSAVGTNTSYYAPYKAMNGVSSDYWWTDQTKSSYTFYNPQKLTVSSITLTYYSSSSSYTASQITVQGSDDNEHWNDLVTQPYVSGQTRTVTVNSLRGYKYHRLVMTASTYVRITNLAIVATYKE